MSVHRNALACILITGCVTPKFVPQSPEIAPDLAAAACSAAGVNALEALNDETFTACDHDTDCAEVSPLVSGTCGHFVNAATFDAHLATFEAQTKACSQAVQLVPVCPSLRAACSAGRCLGESRFELPDECAEGKKALRTAVNPANICNEDADCTLLVGDIVGSVSFSKSSRDAQDSLAKVCGSPAPVLYGMRQPPGVQAFCFEHRCSSERDEKAGKLRTVVRSSSSLKEPEFDQPCFSRAFIEAFKLNDHSKAPPSFGIAMKLRVDESARLSQFQFIDPPRLSVAARSALAARLHDCPALQPARLKGTPVPVMITYRFTFLRN